MLHILDSCVYAHVRKIIFASSGNSLYGQLEAAQLPATEESPLHPQSPLDISKVACECYIRYYTRRYGLKHTILRYADVYGERNLIQPTNLHHPLNYFLNMLAEQRCPIILDSGNAIRDHIFIDDVIQANLCALERGENQTFNIGSGQCYSLNQLYQMAARQMQSQLEPVYMKRLQAPHHSWPLTAPTPLEYARVPIDALQPEPIEIPEVPSAIVLDCGRARQILGWQPKVSPTEGIEQAAKQLRTINTTPIAARPEKEDQSNRTSLGELTAV
jgi:UDP-glucose 4-epimerase